MKGPVVFLDRDGVLCEDRADYVKSWAEWRWVPGALEGAAALARAGRRLVVITNQACVGRGLVVPAMLADIHGRMTAELAAAGAPLAGLYVCPHAPEAGCECRKPKPGLLLRAAQELEIDLAASAFVGDALRDREAAEAAGVGTFLLVLTGQGSESARRATEAGITIRTVADLGEAARLL
ncbi:MAG: HAD-IIIA family hydrolase [Planctomycetes bacterium]|nr:HAD-IIIA family hydrolase [Planctomycetota bacterium]